MCPPSSQTVATQTMNAPLLSVDYGVLITDDEGPRRPQEVDDSNNNDDDNSIIDPEGGSIDYLLHKEEGQDDGISSNDVREIHVMLLPTLLFAYFLGLLAPIFISFDTVILETFVYKSQDRFLSTSHMWFAAVTTLVLFGQYFIFKHKLERILSNIQDVKKYTNDAIEGLQCMLEIRWHLCTFLGMVSSLFITTWFCNAYENQYEKQQEQQQRDGNEDGSSMLLTAQTVLSCGIVLTLLYFINLICMICFLPRINRDNSNTSN